MRELQPLGTPPDPSRVAGVPGMAQAGRRGGREAPAGRRQPSRKIQKAGRAFSQSEVPTYLNTYLNSQQVLKHYLNTRHGQLSDHCLSQQCVWFVVVNRQI